MVLIGLAALAVAGRLVRTTPSAEHPATSAAVTIPPAATATTVDSVEVPDAVGQTLAQAKLVMRAAGLRGAADDRDPQVPGAAVVVQEPAAGNLVPADSVVWFRTRTDVQANGVVRRLRLEAGQTTATYLVVAPDPRVRLVRQPRERVAKVVQGLRLPSSVADGSKDRQASLVAGARVLEVPMV